MSHNRMFLVHVPTGIGVKIGKRMDREWCIADAPAVGDKIELFYEMVFSMTGDQGQDDFTIILQNAEGAPAAAGGLQPHQGWVWDGQAPDGLFDLFHQTAGGEGEGGSGVKETFEFFQRMKRNETAS